MSDETQTPTGSDSAPLKCPECGSHNLHVDDGLVKWCASCGSTAAVVGEDGTVNGWAYATPEVAAKSREYVRKHNGTVPGRKVHADTPRCTAPVQKADTTQKCGARNWQHDGTKLLYCRSCGANYTGDQPANVAEIIATLGPPAPSMYDISPHNPKAFENEDRAHAVTRGPGVSVEEYRAYAGE